MLRCFQIGLRLADLEQLDVGDVYDMLTEQGNDSCDYQQVATQDDFDRFG